MYESSHYVGLVEDIPAASRKALEDYIQHLDNAISQNSARYPRYTARLQQLRVQAQQKLRHYSE